MAILMRMNFNRCIRDSGGLDKDSSNAFLDLELQSQVKYGVTALPTLIVNSVVLHDGVSVNTVFAAICDGCATENIPVYAKLVMCVLN